MSSSDAGALLSFDFERCFPHKAWISGWAADASYPSGFRYKLFSVRHEGLEEIELIILLEQRAGDKEVLKHLDILTSAFDRIAETFISGLGEEHHLDFQVQDFSHCRTAESFEAAAREFGWSGVHHQLPGYTRAVGGRSSIPAAGGGSLTKQWSRRGETSALFLRRISPRGSLLLLG